MRSLRSRRVMRSVVIVAGLGLVLAACAASGNDVAHVNATHLAGFWPGLWHGLISPITFVISLFDRHVSLYDVHNNRNWYNFGFMFGISIVFSGPASGRAGARASSRGRAQKS